MPKLIKNENVDCEVYKKFKPQDTKKVPRSNHDDVRCAIPTFDVNQCSLRGSTFCFCLFRLGLAVTGAPAEHFGTRIHGVNNSRLIKQ